MASRIPASERTSQKLNELLTQGVAEGDARAELLKLAVRKIVEEALEAEVAEAVGRDYYENGAAPGADAAVREQVAKAVVYMAGLPLDANVLFMTVMATKMPFVGRG